MRTFIINEYSIPKLIFALNIKTSLTDSDNYAHVELKKHEPNKTGSFHFYF